MEQDKEQLMISKIDENLFDVFWKQYGDKIKLNKDFIKKVFLNVDFRYKNIISESSVSSVLVKNVGIYDMVNYICAEHRFHLALIKPEFIEKVESDKEYFIQLTNICVDKLITNEFLNVDAKSVISKYNVETSILTMYVNRIFHLLSQCKLDSTSAKQRLQFDIFAKCFMLIKSSLNQLCEGLETEAMSSWRTFHELLCVLCVINKGDENVSQAYFRHLKYGAYNRGEIKDEKEKAIIEQMMEKDMQDLEVKKANKEKFINYGWIHWVCKRYNDEEVKMNFLGGLQKLADLTEYKKYYEIASDVTHSTPLLVYADKKRITAITLKVTYQSFFKIESMLCDFCTKTLNMTPQNSSYLAEYIKFRNMYKPKVELIYQRIAASPFSK